MANVNFTQDNYVDYVASLYLRACGVKDIEFTLKKLEKEGFENVVLVHVSGVQHSDDPQKAGRIVNFDMWPRNEATAEDIDKVFNKVEEKDAEGKVVKTTLVPKHLDDIHFRVGYHTGKDLETGEIVTVEGKPKWIALFNGDTKTIFTGDKREYQG